MEHSLSKRYSRLDITLLSAEGEGVSLDAGIEEADLEGVVGDRAALADELVEPLSRHQALAFGVDISAVAVAGRSAVDGDAEAHGLAVCRGSEDQMQVAGVEPVDDAPALRVENGMLAADRPVARQRPFVDPRRRRFIDVAGVLHGAAPGDSHGADVDAAGEGVVTGERLYQLVRQSGAISDRTFEIRFLDPGVQAYAFTFG